MKRSIFIFFLLVLSSALSARNVSGNVRCGKRGISGVVVTDGKNFAVTSADGKYALEADENAYFVYIVVPSGYNPPFGSGTPLFYKKFKEGKNIYDFKLKKSASRDSYTLLAFADSHIRTERGLKRFRSEIVSDMDSLSKIYIAKGNTAIAGIALGDLAWDKLESLGKYKKAVSKLSYPCYPVIGNHDHDKAVSDDGLAARQYRDKFGPTYYAFNLGHDYYVVLDDVLYHGDRKYDNLISGEQLEWLEGYLKYVPKGSHVIIAMHIPYLIKFKNLKVKGHERLVGMLRDYKVNFMSGHTHVLGTYEAEPGIIEFNIAAACGAWWMGNYCVDGTPLGYKVFESKRGEFSWYYKTAGRNGDFQMELYDRGEVDDDREYVYAKVWGWDSEWKVEWYEDGKPMGNMEQCSEIDPHYAEAVEAAYARIHKKVAEFRKLRESFFFFKAKPDVGTSRIEVVATDRFGRKYEGQIVLK
ncbi:MAG: calcineurin-like phosphoesterase family protein [Bacteroidales bacterium]|jgi:hypothetical protein|nr:calcineurin-like phosphoesterase family protein [Bacteroidales bacterium]MCI2121865.1 calcineurin-like phosphoesterase family protein [Bacteroidales bacterium]MCI2145717.1 calcineurin-like phosphoesterase family protein [Bacteroidales bacterium]